MTGGNPHHRPPFWNPKIHRENEASIEQDASLGRDKQFKSRVCKGQDFRLLNYVSRKRISGFQIEDFFRL